MGIRVSIPSTMGGKPAIGPHQTQTLTLFLLVVIVSCCCLPSNLVLTIFVHTLDSSFSHPHFPNSWNQYISSPFTCIMTILNIELHQLVQLHQSYTCTPVPHPYFPGGQPKIQLWRQTPSFITPMLPSVWRLASDFIQSPKVWPHLKY